jgi:hypothetical protein
MTLRQLVNKLMVSKRFYEDLKKDPEAALRSVGDKPTQKQVEALKKVNYDVLDEIVRVFGYKFT